MRKWAIVWYPFVISCLRCAPLPLPPFVVGLLFRWVLCWCTFSSSSLWACYGGLLVCSLFSSLSFWASFLVASLLLLSVGCSWWVLVFFLSSLWACCFGRWLLFFFVFPPCGRAFRGLTVCASRASLSFCLYLFSDFLLLLLLLLRFLLLSAWVVFFVICFLRCFFFAAKASIVILHTLEKPWKNEKITVPHWN